MTDAPCLKEMSAAEYHADPCPTPSLSASVATAILTRSPYHAWLRHPKLGGVSLEPTREMGRGTIIHALVLGTPCPVETIAADNYRTKAAQEQRDAAAAAGRVPLLAREYDEALATADAVLVALREQGVVLAGISEQAAFWREETPSGPVLCRGLLDHTVLTDAGGVIYDLKTGATADPRHLGRKCLDYGYDVQAAAYTSALEQVRPDLAGRVEWRWLFVEELPAGSPRRVLLTVARPSGLMREHGRARWARACVTWAACLRDDHWPGYATEPVAIDPPAWAAAEELGA